MAKVPPDRLRSLAINVRVHRDYDEVPWLSEQVAKSEDLVGLMALRALAVLDIARAIEAITLLPKDELYMGRNHWLPDFLTRDPDAVVVRLEKLIDGEPDDWRVLKAFQGHEYRLPSRIWRPS